LHFGSLVAALASWLDARATGSRWLVRIEDLDQPRVQRGIADEILRTLDRLGLYWDGEVIFQSRRTALYEETLARLGDTYLCGCSRREIADSAVSLAADGAQVYPGTCRTGLPAGKSARALRIRVAGTVTLRDRVQGELTQDLEREVGDFVLRRADGQFAYQLAVVVDDAAQGVTEVVRGADLLDSTPRQIYLQRLLGLATPRYLHVPVAVDARGEKLSKHSGAQAIGEEDLRSALRFLGQPASETLGDAVRAWDPALIPARRAAAAPP
jgi:glutamyl-Q tRNA(Asp) synthetase